MRKFTVLSGALVLSVAAMVLTAGPAQASTTVTTTCTAPVLYQPFLPWNDGNWYSLLPGESYDNVDGTGWTLSNGASLQAATLYDATQGSVLTLPSGAKAVSPVLCLNNTFPYMRMMLHSVAAGSVSFYISYLQSNGVWKTPQSTGSVTSS